MVLEGIRRLGYGLEGRGVGEDGVEVINWIVVHYRQLVLVLG